MQINIYALYIYRVGFGEKCVCVYLIGSMWWYIVHVSLTHSVSVLLYELRAVEGGQQREQKPAILIISHSTAIITLTYRQRDSD